MSTGEEPKVDSWVEVEVSGGMATSMVSGIALTSKSPPNSFIQMSVDVTAAVGILLAVASPSNSKLVLGPMPEQYAKGSMTWDLMLNFFREVGVQITAAFVTELTDNIYYGAIHWRHLDQDHTMKCRPSDGIALALRTKVPIFVSSDLMTPLEDIAAEQADGEETASQSDFDDESGGGHSATQESLGDALLREGYKQIWGKG